MKMFCLIVLAAVTAGTAARAQSNTNAAPELRLANIHSDGADFDGKARTATYYGNVRVTDPQMKLTCARLTADLPASGGHLNHVVAETNVVVDVTNVTVDVKDPKGRTVHATGQKAVYDYSVQSGVTNETVTLTGNPQPRAIIYEERDILTNSADVIIWDRANNSFHFSGNYHSTAKVNETPAGTNAPAVNTNEFDAKLTNSPPETIDRMIAPQQSRGF